MKSFTILLLLLTLLTHSLMAQDDEFRLEDLAIELASTHEETQNSFNAEIEKIARAGYIGEYVPLISA